MDFDEMFSISPTQQAHISQPPRYSPGPKRPVSSKFISSLSFCPTGYETPIGNLRTGAKK